MREGRRGGPDQQQQLNPRRETAWANLFSLSHSALHPQDGSAATGKCPATGPNEYLCRACYAYAALHVGGAAMLCLHLALTGVLADRRSDAALARMSSSGIIKPLPSLPM